MPHLPQQSLRRKGDAPWVSDLTLLQVLDKLSQPAFCGGVILQDLGEGGVLQLIRKALPESFTCPTSRDKKRGPTNKLTGARGEQTPLGTKRSFAWRSPCQSQPRKAEQQHCSRWHSASQTAPLPPLTLNPAKQPPRPNTQQQSDAMPGETEATNTHSAALGRATGHQEISLYSLN